MPSLRSGRLVGRDSPDQAGLHRHVLTPRSWRHLVGNLAALRDDRRIGRL